jgi:hypothetical protein
LNKPGLQIDKIVIESVEMESHSKIRWMKGDIKMKRNLLRWFVITVFSLTALAGCFYYSHHGHEDDYRGRGLYRGDYYHGGDWDDHHKRDWDRGRGR